jgi:nucleoside-diphosphate-sugar epimerase
MLLLTGGTGHVGGQIIKHLVHNKTNAVATYRGAEPPETASSDQPYVTWVKCDINDAAKLSDLGERYAIKSCIHGAAVSNEAYAFPDPSSAVITNIGATAVLLETARLQNWDRFILVGTGSVFEKRKWTGAPIPEDAPLEPGNVYSVTKASSEMLCEMYRTHFGLSASVVRISWVYGPPVVARDATRGPIPSFVIRALRGEVIHEDGADFSAGFTYIEDVANGLLAAAAANQLNEPVYHLSHGLNFSLGEVADAISDIVPGADIKLGPGTLPWTKFTAMRDPLSAQNLRADAGFEPTFLLDKGISQFAKWLRANSELWSD